MANNNIYLSRSDLDTLSYKYKKIGEGTEGACYVVGDEIYKIYHQTYQSKDLIFNNTYVDDEGVRIFDKNKIKEAQSIAKDARIIKYTDKDGVKLSVEDGLQRAINKGHRIVGTKLPTNIIYVDGSVKGCVYPYYKNTKSIYATYKKLFKTRLKVCRDLLTKVQELLDNNIYPIDLCQKGESNLFDRSIANVLLDRRNNPIIIDLEGKSTLYTDTYNEQLSYLTTYSLGILLLELMTREDIQEDMIDEDYDRIEEYLREAGLTNDQYNRFMDERLTTSDLSDILTNIERKR